MTKREKLEMFIEYRNLNDKQARKLRKCVRNGAIKWRRDFDFFLWTKGNRAGPWEITTGLDRDSKQFHAVWV